MFIYKYNQCCTEKRLVNSVLSTFISLLVSVYTFIRGQKNQIGSGWISWGHHKSCLFTNLMSRTSFCLSYWQSLSVCIGMKV